MVSSVQMWAWASIASGLGIHLVLPSQRHGRACPGHPRLSFQIRRRRGCPAQEPVVGPAKGGT